MRINIVHALPYSSSAFGQDFDGFTAAVEIMAQEHDVRWVNVHPANHDHIEQQEQLRNADFVMVRSDWGWYPDRAAARRLAGTNIPCGLIIAGSHAPSSTRQALRYDALFYETPWYAQFVEQHPLAIEAFGVDTRAMYDKNLERDIDWLFVGRLADFKRPLRLLDKPGRKVVVGDLSTAPRATREALLASEVELVDHVTQRDLGSVYSRAKNVLVPCELQGGGERAVLEARACGCKIEVASDNPKLASLLTGPVPTHEDYARRLLETIETVLSGSRTSRSQKAVGAAAAELMFNFDKIRRAPETLQIRWKDGTLIPGVGPRHKSD